MAGLERTQCIEGENLFLASEVLAIKPRRGVSWNHCPVCFRVLVDSGAAVAASQEITATSGEPSGAGHV